jgi:glutathione S-transferase
VYESLGIMSYLDRKYPERPLFGSTPEEAGTIARVISEFQSYVEDQIMKIIYAILFQGVEERMDEVARAIHIVAGEARTIDKRLSQSNWLVGESFSAADVVVFPGIKMLLRALDRREAQELRSRLLPIETNFPGIAAWMKRIEELPGYERTVPPHWKEKAPDQA